MNVDGRSDWEQYHMEGNLLAVEKFGKFVAKLIFAEKIGESSHPQTKIIQQNSSVTFKRNMYVAIACDKILNINAIAI